MHSENTDNMLQQGLEHYKLFEFSFKLKADEGCITSLIIFKMKFC